MREDEIIENKYNLPIRRQCFEDYIELLINKIFKLLPLYEGLSLTKEVVYTSEQAYKHFQMHLEEVIVEVTGNYYIYNNSPRFLQLLSILDGMRDIKLDEHKLVRTLVFKCTNICSELEKSLQKEE